MYGNDRKTYSAKISPLILTVSLLIGLMIFSGVSVVGSAAEDVRWGTASTGSTGYSTSTTLAKFIGEEMPKYKFTVLPTPGYVYTLKAFCKGYYDVWNGGANMPYELKNQTFRFKGFEGKRAPIQSFWSYSLEMGLAIHARNADKYDEWSDLEGKTIFTGPAPWSVRVVLRNALEAVGIDYTYKEIDLSMVASQLEKGNIAASIIYTSSKSSISPWLTQAELATDLAVLNPSEEEIKKIEEAGQSVVTVDSAKVFGTNMHVDELKLVPAYYGHHIDLPKEDLYKLLTIVEDKADQIAEVNPALVPLSKNMAEFQVEALKTQLGYLPIHPGLAKYLREKGLWNSSWNKYIAEGADWSTYVAKEE